MKVSQKGMHSLNEKSQNTTYRDDIFKNKRLSYTFHWSQIIFTK
jgi:hypothetical protein